MPRSLDAVSDPLKTTQPAELIIGLVSPLGTDLEIVTDVLCDELAKAGYRPEMIRISELIRSIPQFNKLATDFEDERLRDHMSAGTSIRETISRGDALALLAVPEIRERRAAITGDERNPSARVAYIIRSIKHPGEVTALRDIYGQHFLVISAYADRPQRIASLAKSIASSRNETDTKKYQKAAEELVTRDEEEEGKKLGQDVTDAFPEGDFFIEVSSRQAVAGSISRLLDLLFGYPYGSPSLDEFGMFTAYAASLRSVDLSRQVGAAIVSEQGDLITVGCNEVPKAGGGQYWPGSRDFRDFQKGFDSSEYHKREILKEVLSKLMIGGIIKENPKQASTLADELIKGEKREVLAGASS